LKRKVKGMGVWTPKPWKKGEEESQLDDRAFVDETAGEGLVGK